MTIFTQFKKLDTACQVQLVEVPGQDIVLTRTEAVGAQLMHLYFVRWSEMGPCKECGCNTKRVTKDGYCLAEDGQGAFEQVAGSESDEPILISAERVPFRIRGWGSRDF